MQCPSCGFENMPGMEACVACSSLLSEKQTGQSVFPPRKRDRTLRQRLTFRVPGRLRNLVENAQLRMRMQNAARSFDAFFAIPPWACPRNLGRLLISAIPGSGIILSRKNPAMGWRMLVGSVVALLLAALLYRTPFADMLVWCVIVLSMYSVFVAANALREDVEGVPSLRVRSLGVALLVVAAYFGSYALLRLAISPALDVIRVVNMEPVGSIRSGDSLLLRRTGSVRRGDVVFAGNRYGPLFGPVVGVPGDIVTVSDRIYVNGQPVIARGLMLRAADVSREIALKRDEYWIYLVPPDNVAAATGPEELVRVIADSGRVARWNVRGRLVAITSPPSRRMIISADSWVNE